MIHQERAGDQFKSTSFTNESVPGQIEKNQNKKKKTLESSACGMPPITF